ncbi:CDP-glucose 4,6-dehydratase [Ruegeria sp. HKCCD8929]|uniref:CDP-glucose 4,6-dehydratase n=1 Tax=Ruegeria sp. HKCCD8929 TaxID=2683006 RepID=UPI001487F33B|nr:CDP-glucose 4,6-dehydratase [Ruegeria sp. HKCCD8929]
MAGQVDPIFGGIFSGRRVLVTGHSGFKGGWLSVWLYRLGAQLTGVSLPPEKGPSFYDACGLPVIMDSRFADIRDPAALQKALADVDAEVVFHMAAQPLVRRSYREPAETFATNVSGTAHVLDAALKMKSLKAVVVVTSDKCYDNKEWTWGYRENDPMGGRDPYSASKGCTELVAQAYQHSFFGDPQGPQLTTVRAGNVFGGGDWGEDRLVPDIVRSAEAGKPLHIRSPFSVRPWQHVLEPISGYLGLAAKLLEKGQPFAGPWNFGPDVSGTVNVRNLAMMMQHSWGAGAPEFTFHHTGDGPPDGMHEAGILRLDSTKAQTRLGWRPQLDLPEAIQLTVDWYRSHAAGEAMAGITDAQIGHYSNLMSSDMFDRATVAAQ